MWPLYVDQLAILFLERRQLQSFSNGVRDAEKVDVVNEAVFTKLYGTLCNFCPEK